MICVSLAEPDYQRCTSLLENCELAEIRLEACNFTIAQVRELFSGNHQLVATCRPGNLPAGERKRLLLTAVEAGARYVDVELEANDSHHAAILESARRHNCTLIVSYHNYQCTPPAADLAAVVNSCYQRGADLAKVACLVQTHRDTARILGLYDDERPLIALGMGSKGWLTRVLAPRLGAPFTYARPDSQPATAPGQLTVQQLRQYWKVWQDG